MRSETEVYNKSVLVMENFMPTLQGTAERTPGTQFIEEITAVKDKTRIIPYLTPVNDRAIVELSEGAIRFLPNVTQHLGGDSIPSGPPVGGILPIRRQIVPNGVIDRGERAWIIDPERFPSNVDDNWVGGLFRPAAGEIWMRARRYKLASTDPLVVSASNSAIIPKDTAVITVSFAALYQENIPLKGGYEFTFWIGTTEGAKDLLDEDFKDHATSDEIGASCNVTLAPTVNLLEGAEIFITVTLTATVDNKETSSTPLFKLFHFTVLADDEAVVGDGSIVGTPPWLADELQDIHFIQSPLMPYEVGKVSKELVLVHPSHPPHRLYYHETNALYTLDPIVFTNEPLSWTIGNYPATCGSYHGRLVLAGSEGKPKLGAAISGDTETVWCTESGKWDVFSDQTGVNPDDSVEFTTTYRSPIQWVYGQKDLLVGALELEYIASAEGIFQPADLGVYMHSSHGSNHVQPAGFGEMVLFPAEGGTKVRAMQKSSDDEGWVAPDVTLVNPHICVSGIKRMIRMRNPHQMLVVLLTNGNLAVLHYDTQAGVNGWSRMEMGGQVQDICVMANEQGEDVMFLTIIRRFGSNKNLYLEAIANWTEHDTWQYLESHTVFDLQTETNVLTGLGHLQGKHCQVTSNGSYLGVFKVEAPGTITLVDQIGSPVNVNNAIVGLPMESRLQTLPLVGADPRSKKRYTQISVRVRASTLPLIGAGSRDEEGSEASTSRPVTRDPRQNVGDTQRLSGLGDATVSNRGWSTKQTVWVVENIPQKVEVIGIFGKLQDTKL